MKVIIKKELTNPVMVDGRAEVLGPHYHIHTVDDHGQETFVKTVDRDIKEAAREAERILDLDLLEVTYQEHGPDYFKSTIPLPPSVVDLYDVFSVEEKKEDEGLIFPSKVYTTEEAIELAKEYGLEFEVMQDMENGLTPNEALREWDLL